MTNQRRRLPFNETLFVALLLVSPAGARAQQDESAAVLSAVDSLFQGMRTKDTALVRRVFEPGARLVGMRPRGQGSQLQVLTVDQFVNFIARDTRGEWVERAFEPEVRIERSLATVWAQYDFHLAGQPTHCGVDAVQLLKIGDSWRIVGLADTYVTETCPARPPLGRASGQAPASDTARIEVGSPAVNGSVYRPHRARVRVHLGSLDTPPTNEWTNELTIGDSAGRKVMRWVTLGQFDSSGAAGFDLRQTFDLVTMAPMGYNLKTRSGVLVSLAIDGNRMRGTRKLPASAEPEQVDQVIPRMGFIASASDLVPLAVGFTAGSVYIAPVWGPNMATAESRIFSVIGKVPTVVEGTEWQAWKVEERRESDRRLMAVWYLVEGSPYMVAGEVFLPNGQVQKITEIALP